MGHPLVKNDTTSNTTNIGTLNPFRYRGYMYDEDSGLYYLRSRYYNPKVGRFINADDTDVLDADNENIVQYNLYVYCFNNPVNMIDQDGFFPLALAGGGCLTGLWAAGGSNFWNPVGWVLIVTGVVITGITIGQTICEYSKTKVDPYARAGQKKQNRERKEKKKADDKKWKQRSTPKKFKKHTPGRDHGKYGGSYLEY